MSQTQAEIDYIDQKSNLNYLTNKNQIAMIYWSIINKKKPAIIYQSNIKETLKP